LVVLAEVAITATSFFTTFCYTSLTIRISVFFVTPSAEKLMPQAQILGNRFHVMKQVTNELDEARKSVKRETSKIKNKKNKENILAGIAKSKYVLLKNEEDLVEKERKKLAEVYKVSLKLGEMHKLKEEFREVFEKNTDGNGGLLVP
jgi:transposase